MRYIWVDVSPLVLLTLQSKLGSITSYAVSQILVNSSTYYVSSHKWNHGETIPSIRYGTVVRSAWLSRNVKRRLLESINVPSVGQPEAGMGEVDGA